MPAMAARTSNDSYRASSSLPRVPAELRSQSDLPTLPRSRQPIFGSGFESDRREPVISSVTGRQLGDLPNMIQPPLLGVVNAASAVSARTLDLAGAGRAAELLDAVGVHGRTGAPAPQIGAARAERGAVPLP